MRAIALILLVFLSSPAPAQDSTCYGSTRNGRLENGVKLPSEGANFVSYGKLPALAGRTYVHSKVRDVIIDAYRWLETEQPDKVYKYAETGFAEGGRFKPHKTHRNGLSVDFMVPVLDAQGRSVHLPTHPLNRYGYNIELDESGRYEGYQIDYEALGAHLAGLHKAARTHGVGIWRVIFDPGLQPYLYRTRYGDYVRNNIDIPTTRSWVRHDEHYHVDFIVQCKPIQR